MAAGTSRLSAPQCWHNEAGPKWPPFSRRHFQMDFLEWKLWISINISLKFVPSGPINNIPTLVQVMAWCRPGNKPLSEPMMVRLPTHICVTLPQWVNTLKWVLKPSWTKPCARVDSSFPYIHFGFDQFSHLENHLVTLRLAGTKESKWTA